MEFRPKPFVFTLQFFFYFEKYVNHPISLQLWVKLHGKLCFLVLVGRKSTGRPTLDIMSMEKTTGNHSTIFPQSCGNSNITKKRNLLRRQQEITPLYFSRSNVNAKIIKKWNLWERQWGNNSTTIPKKSWQFPDIKEKESVECYNCLCPDVTEKIRKMYRI